MFKVSYYETWRNFFRLISSSLIPFMVASMATSWRRAENFSSKARKPFTSSMRRILALSSGAKLKPNISLNRQESSPPKKSMFPVQIFFNAHAEIDPFTPEPKLTWRLVPRKSSFQHLRLTLQCMYAVLITMNTNPVRTSCVHFNSIMFGWQSERWSSYLDLKRILHHQRSCPSCQNPTRQLRYRRRLDVDYPFDYCQPEDCGRTYTKGLAWRT